MPLSSLYTQPHIQKHLVDKIQGPMVATFSALAHAPSNLIFLVGLAWEAIKIIREIRKLPVPVHSNTNRHNSKVMVTLRDEFLKREDPHGPRYRVFEGILNFIIIKYEFDNYTGRRLNWWLREWKKSDWTDDGKFPETYWTPTPEDKETPTYIRQQALKDALHNKEWGKVADLVN